jgi:hypothetical protein
MIRVLPRDAFNDANLLKCIGQLTLLIEDGEIDLRYEYDGEPFDIVQDGADGSTYVSNIQFFTKDGQPLQHSRPMNSRNAWSLVLELDDDVQYAFDDKGCYDANF